MVQIMNYVLPGTVVLVALFAVIGALTGLRRGIVLQTLRLASMAVALVASFLITSSLYDRILLFCDGKTFSDIFTSLHLSMVLNVIPPDLLALLDGVDPTSVGYVAALPIAGVLLPLVLVVLFFVFYLVISIIYKIVACLLGFMKGLGGAAGRGIGALLGAAQGALIAALILLPVVGCAVMYSDAVTVMRERDPEGTHTGAAVAFHDTYCEPFLASPVVQAVRAAGGDYICTRLATVELDGGVVSLRDETGAYAAAFTTAAQLQGADFNHLTEENKAAIRELVQQAGDNYYMQIVLSGVLRAFASSIQSGTLSITAEDPYRSFAEAVIGVFTTSDKTNVVGDLSTLTEAYFILSDTGILENFNNGTEAWRDLLAAEDASGENALRHTVAILDANPRTRPITDQLTQISLNMMMNQLDAPWDMQVVVENVRTGLNDVLAIDRDSYEDETAYVSAVADTMDDALKKSGIEIERDILDGVAQELADNEEFQELAGADTATVTEFVLTYYDVYLAMTKS